MKTALVIHPWLRIWAGGEFICMKVCELLQMEGYHVRLVSDEYDPSMAERIYGMGEVLSKCEHIPLGDWNVRDYKPIFGLRFYALRRILELRKIQNRMKKIPADVVFSTQGHLFVEKNRPVYHFVYNIVDLVYSLSASALRSKLISYLGDEIKLHNPNNLQWRIYLTMMEKLRDLLIGDPRSNIFLGLSHHVYHDLVSNGFENAQMIFPVSRLDFKPATKKKQIITASRIIPEKRLEVFFDIARKLPQYQFVLVARNSSDLMEMQHSSGYFARLFKDKPANVNWINSSLKDSPEILGESAVYVYAGIERGIGIAVMEACGAGCIPITPTTDGGAEVVDAIGAGFKFRNITEAVESIKEAIENPPWTPDEIRERAVKAFDPSVFQERLRDLLK